MVLWKWIIGALDFVPFTDRFVTVLFLIISSFFISVLFFYLSNIRSRILPYTALSSMVLTYPLINEIFEYTGADFQYTGNLALVVLTFLFLSLNEDKKTIKTLLIATLLMILPAASYEVGIFSYITLLCVVIFYKYCVIESKHLSLRQWVKENLYYILPILFAVFFRFFIAFVLRELYDLSYHPGGATGIDYENTSLSYLVGSNGYRYFLAGLVYLPITIFVFSFILFLFYFVRKSFVNYNFQTIILGFIVCMSIFSISIIQGVSMQYRTAQAITVFVAFVTFLLCSRCTRFYVFINCLILFLCWHQAAYLNNVLSLNNMRSNNEAASIRYIGLKLLSECNPQKPVILITNPDFYEGYLGPWISKRVYANSHSWNGKIFNSFSEKYLPQKYHHYKFINTNVLNATGLGGTENNYFSYYGFKVNIKNIKYILQSIKDKKREKEVYTIYENAKKTLPPLNIIDLPECIIVKML